jgi:hypothetical protein
MKHFNGHWTEIMNAGHPEVPLRKYASYPVQLGNRKTMTQLDLVKSQFQNLLDHGGAIMMSRGIPVR